MKKPQGNKTEASTDYHDPVGSNDKSTPPPTSGYDEKQPLSKKEIKSTYSSKRSIPKPPKTSSTTSSAAFIKE